MPKWPSTLLSVCPSNTAVAGCQGQDELLPGQQHLKFRVSVSVQKRKNQNIFNKKTAHSLYCVKVSCMKIRFFYVLLHNYF
jgi:hypothetical protein